MAVIQTFVDFLDFHPHLHIISSDECFYDESSFIVSLVPNTKDLEDAFKHKVFNMLKAEGKINDAVIENMIGWHNIFSIFIANIPSDLMMKKAWEIWHAILFGHHLSAKLQYVSQGRMTYIAQAYRARI